MRKHALARRFPSSGPNISIRSEANSKYVTTNWSTLGGGGDLGRIVRNRRTLRQNLSETNMSKLLVGDCGFV